MPRISLSTDRDYPNRVRELRVARSLTLKELADASSLYFTQINKIETGERPAKDHDFRLLGRALGVPPADLFHIREGGLTGAERLMIDTYRELPPAMQRALMAMVESQQAERIAPEK